jgi:hypothetical protein
MAPELKRLLNLKTPGGQLSNFFETQASVSSAKPAAV